MDAQGLTNSASWRWHLDVVQGVATWPDPLQVLCKETISHDRYLFVFGPIKGSQPHRYSPLLAAGSFIETHNADNPRTVLVTAFIRVARPSEGAMSGSLGTIWGVKMGHELYLCRALLHPPSVCLSQIRPHRELRSPAEVDRVGSSKHEVP